MSSTDLATVLIACPNCGTRYQVPFATLGASGREVQCAQCSLPWHATADEPVPPPIDPDALFAPAEEAALDREFEREAHAAAPAPAAHAGDSLDPSHARTLADIRAAIAPKPKKPATGAVDPAVLKAQRSFDKRQLLAQSRLPLARIRRAGRFVSLLVLAGVLLGSYFLRVELVRAFPALAGVYAAIGVPVNVIGLEFGTAQTLSSLSDGKTVMKISAKIRSVSNQPIVVPPVLVTLLGKSGTAIYEWTVNVKAPQLEPGEVLDFSTEVNSPPPGAIRVRLSFTTSRGGVAASAQAQ